MVVLWSILSCNIFPVCLYFEMWACKVSRSAPFKSETSEGLVCSNLRTVCKSGSARAWRARVVTPAPIRTVVDGGGSKV